MLLINSISNTKKFFQKTIDNVKSFLTKGNTTYERLPKTPPFHHFPPQSSDHKDIGIGYRDLDSFYSEFTHQWDTQKGKMKIKTDKQRPFQKATKEMVQKAPQTPARKAASPPEGVKPNTLEECKRVDKYELVKQSSELCSRSVRERRLSCVVEKLKELELMDKGSCDLKMDVDEILHYYSRLTCPAFLDIVDKFFTEVCSEFYGSKEVLVK